MTNQELLNNLKQYPWGEGGLKVMVMDGDICTITGLEDNKRIVTDNGISNHQLKPILYPMPEFDDLPKKLKLTGNHPSVKLVRNIYHSKDYQLLPQWIFQHLLDNKYNIFNLPESEFVDASKGDYYE